ncbi:hypothetical protein SEA_FORREST_152 [Streptomyces phage Forrest]|nr:hypothetical protein SEA_FORREST_152 [Streptomyces phage Forrest]
MRCKSPCEFDSRPLRMKKAHDEYNIYCDGCQVKLITFGEFEAVKCLDCILDEKDEDSSERIELTEEEWYEIT